MWDVNRAGTVGATTRRWIRLVEGKRFITAESRWMVVDHIPGYEPDRRWDITVEGRPAVNIQLQLGRVSAAHPGRYRVRKTRYSTPYSRRWSGRFQRYAGHRLA